MQKLFLMLTIVAVMNVAAVAQIGKKDQARAWKKFQTAIAKNDKQTVASMIEFPFEASILGENLNFKIETKEDFLKNYDSIFTRARRQKIVRGKITLTAEDDEFNFEMFENGAYHVFMFRKIGSVYKLAETMAAG